MAVNRGPLGRSGPGSPILAWLVACGSPAAPAAPVEVAPAAAPAEAAPAEAVPAAPLPVSGAFRRELSPGLVVAAYEPPSIPDPGYSRPPPEAVVRADRRLFVVTIDPAFYEIVHLSELELGGDLLTASEWAAKHELHVAFNPGMFEPSGAGTGYTRSGTFVSQPQVRRQELYRSWFLADPSRDGLPAVAVVDQIPPKGAGTYGALAELPADFVGRLSSYRVAIQSLAVMRDGKGTYPARKNQWSELAFGTDREGRVAVVFSRFPYEMRELGARIEALGLGIDGLLHGEGGPEATLVVRAGGVEIVQVGSYETGFADDGNQRQWALPAVLGARPRAAP